MILKRRAPSGRQMLHKVKERPSFNECANCKSEMHGMKRLLSNENRKLSASQKRPQRAFGGYFCANCGREFFRAKARGEQ